FMQRHTFAEILIHATVKINRVVDPDTNPQSNYRQSSYLDPDLHVDHQCLTKNRGNVKRDHDANGNQYRAVSQEYQNCDRRINQNQHLQFCCLDLLVNCCGNTRTAAGQKKFQITGIIFCGKLFNYLHHSIQSLCLMILEEGWNHGKITSRIDKILFGYLDTCRINGFLVTHQCLPFYMPLSEGGVYLTSHESR